MGITLANKFIDKNVINCDGTFQVTLALAASPDINSNPTDILLVLDRSGSMAGDAMANLKLGAKGFVDIIANATGGTSTIEGGSRIGIVSFATDATLNLGLSTSVSDLKSAIDSLIADGSTNHAAAFTKAIDSFDPLSANPKVLVMFTDGKTTIGGDPDPVAASAKAMGIINYMIGLLGEDGVDVAKLNLWASDPDASHVAVTPDAAELEILFRNLANNITKTGATNIVIDELLNPEFQIVCVNAPTKGSVSQMGNRSLQWRIAELGVSGNEGASVSLTVRHIGVLGGGLRVNESIKFQDNEGSVVIFPDPIIDVDCGERQCAECVPAETDAYIEGCRDAIVIDMGDVRLDSVGRIAEVRLNVKNVCPGRGVSLGVFLNEVDEAGEEIKRGFKTFHLPPHSAEACRDIEVRCIRFVLPENDEYSCMRMPLCGTRHLKARAIAHYSDYEFEWEQEI